MLVQPLVGFESSGSLSISPDKSILKVIRDREEKFIDPFLSGPLSTQTDLCAPDGTTFREILSISKDSPKRYVIARVELYKDDKLSKKKLDLIDLGMTCTIPLDKLQGHLPDDNCSELLMTLFHVLRKTKNSRSILAIIEIADPSQIKTDENVVAVMDLLGFSNIMRTVSLDELEQRFTNGLGASLAYGSLLSCQFLVFDRKGNIINLTEDMSPISYGVISDTVILYLRDKNNSPLRTICETVALLLDYGVTLQKWLFRGAVDIGSFRAIPEGNLYLGSALANAHELEISQEWSGCILSNSIETRFVQELGALLEEGVIVDFDVPFKAQGRVIKNRALVVNWCYFDQGHGEKRLATLQSLLKDAPEMAKIKIQNTMEFLEAMQEKGLVSVKKKFVTAINMPSMLRKQTKGT